ncbi:CYTH domain-containing protein [Arsenicicoccus piscis]|uniref:CYTH domain-containing protein n=1 Tax=Arsenicicoccus piscis TaxID=673954 RepID=A0ABQ6HU98_9MICO|nr:CYTH domain-containing protein [Arsenicicoccus piscis]GMA21890.1 hypothetical protein GCM10025862_39110 [Arsenicicoccus piscis]
MSHDSIEIERKYDVDADQPVPDLTALGWTVRTTVADLDACYLDTPSLDLTDARVTLRRRLGGADSGWHAKLQAPPESVSSREEPTAAGGQRVRRELHVPIGADEPADHDDVTALVVPAELTEAVARSGALPDPGVLAAGLLPLVRVRNHRTTHLLSDADGPVAEVCDDVVTTTGLRAGVPDQRWREWEVELVGPQADELGEVSLQRLDAVERLLLAAGARPATGPSKLVRALG